MTSGGLANRSDDEFVGVELLGNLASVLANVPGRPSPRCFNGTGWQISDRHDVREPLLVLKHLRADGARAYPSVLDGRFDGVGQLAARIETGSKLSGGKPRVANPVGVLTLAKVIPHDFAMVLATRQDSRLHRDIGCFIKLRLTAHHFLFGPAHLVLRKVVEVPSTHEGHHNLIGGFEKLVVNAPGDQAHLSGGAGYSEGKIRLRSNTRDDFTMSVKEALAKRVGFRCSKPDCRQGTSGPHSDLSKFVNVGIACHITAAAAGGPRYDASLTPEQRTDITNGIFLCQTHAKLIDSDATKYSVAVLRRWKDTSEQMTQQELDATNSQGNRDLIATSGRLTAVLSEAMDHFDRLSGPGARDCSDPNAHEVARQLEQRIGGLVVDALALNANPLFDEADRQTTGIAVKTMKAALRMCGFQYREKRVDYDEDTFRAVLPASQN